MKKISQPLTGGSYRSILYGFGLALVCIGLIWGMGIASATVPAFANEGVVIDFNAIPNPSQIAPYTGHQEKGYDIAVSGNMIVNSLVTITDPTFDGNYVQIPNGFDDSTLTITKIGGGAFRFVRLPARIQGAISDRPLTIQGYSGGAGGTLIATDAYTVTSVTGAYFNAANLAGQAVDTLVIRLVGSGGTVLAVDNIGFEDVPPTGSITVVKNALGGDGAFTFTTQSLITSSLALEPVGRGVVLPDNSHSSNYVTTNPQRQLSNYLTGQSGGTRSRSFFVYDLPSAAAGQQVMAARLRLYSGPAGLGVSGESTISVHNVDGAVSDLENSTTPFASLGGGAALGSRTYTQAADADGGYREIELNAAGVAAINAALGGKYALSLLSSAEATDGVYAFAQTGAIGPDVDDGQSQLILTWGGSFSLTTSSGTAQRLFDNLPAGTYDIAEDTSSGWRLVSATCSDGSDPDTIQLAAGENVTCTFTNERVVYLPIISR